MTSTALPPPVSPPNRHYRNFHLKLFQNPLDKGYYVEAIETPLSRSDAVRLDLPDLTDLAERVSQFKQGTADLGVSKKLGGALFQALLPSPIREIWDRSQGAIEAESILRLRLDIRCQELAALPWEMLYDAGRRYFLSTAPQRPIVRYVYDAASERPLSRVSDLDVLIAVSRPSGFDKLAAAEQEVAAILDALGDLRARGRVRVDVLERATIRKLQEALLRGYHVLHFVGHGLFEEGVGHLVFEDDQGDPEWIDGETLAVFCRETPLRLLVLNSCETADASAVDPLLGVAQSALVAEVPAVVAMQGPIRDQAAAVFARGFYLALAEGYPLETCMTEGRKAIIAQNHRMEPADWAVPVLFSNAPTGLLWESDPSPAARSLPPPAPLPVVSTAVRGAPPLDPRSPDSRPPEPRSSEARAPGVLHNLPEPGYARFVDRFGELAAVLQALAPESETPVVVLTGLRGVGRSALAQEVARRCLEISLEKPEDPWAFRGIVWASAQKAILTSQGTAQMPASTLWSLDDLVLTIATALKKSALIQARTDERLSLLEGLLREARYLLVLDDIDELQDPRCLDFLKKLGAPSRAVVTSGSPVDTGLEIPLGSLKREAALELVREDARAAGLRAIEEASRADLEELVRQADGLPLALRWVVGQLKDSREPLSEVVERLAQAGRQTLAEFCLRSSVERLTPPQRRLLLAFALLPQPTTAEAASAAAGVEGEDLDRALQRLVRLRLLEPADGPGQYRMMLLTRQYGLADLDRDPSFRKDAVRRAVDFMADFAEDAAPPGQQPDSERLEGEVGNLLWAARQAYEIKDWKKVLDFRKALGDFLYNCGYWNEGIQLGEWAFDAADRLGEHKERAWCALYPLARQHFHQGNYAEAEKWGERALALFEQQKDDRGMALALRYLGRVMQARGELDRAEETFRQGLEKTLAGTRDKDLEQQGHLRASLAGLAEARKQYPEASQWYEEALALYQKTGDLMGIATTLQALGRVALRLRRFDEARSRLDESLGMVQGRSWTRREGEVLLTLAQLAEDQGDLARAQDLLIRARELFQDFSAADELAQTDAALTRVAAALAAGQGPAGGA